MILSKLANVAETVAHYLLAAFVFVGLLFAITRVPPHDDTDPPNGRSGLSLYVDHKTGCQYIKAGSIFGGELTPRLDANGRHMCGLAENPAEQKKEK